MLPLRVSTAIVAFCYVRPTITMLRDVQIINAADRTLTSTGTELGLTDVVGYSFITVAESLFAG